MWLTEDEIVDDLEQRLALDDKRELANRDKNDLIDLHHGLGTWIRNAFDLWHGNPITEKWRKDPSSRIMDPNTGADASPDHPDAVSMRIIEKLWDRLQYLRKP